MGAQEDKVKAEGGKENGMWELSRTRLRLMADRRTGRVSSLGQG